MSLLPVGWFGGLSLAEIAAPLSVSQRLSAVLEHEEVRGFLGAIGMAALAGVLLSIIAIWLASKILAEEPTFGKAVHLWLLQILSAIIAAVAIAGALFAVITLKKPEWILFAVGGGFLLYVLLLLMMVSKVYQVQFPRALGILVLSIIFSAILSAGLEFTPFGSRGMAGRIPALERVTGKTDAEKAAFHKRLFGTDAEDEIERALDDTMRPLGKPKPLAEREAAVRSIQQQLEIRRRGLAADDVTGAAKLQELIARYAQLLNAVKVERAASTGQPARAPAVL
ncbi:MAG TPA: hypothetical protein VGO90_05635 [Chthoniobacteraceae bacterium]|jgi:uncharacterized membrane protein|nr:hypothetical protein [Chthoniobacteraceae bacterium]